MFQTVRTIDVTTTVKACFEQLAIEVETTKRIIGAQDEKRKNRMTKRTFEKLRAFTSKSRRLRYCKEFFGAKIS